MPTMDMCSVRGMGVAVSVSTSTVRLSFLMASLWVTPKRCSSSTTRSPKSLKFTSFPSSLCVPMTTSSSPASRRRSTSFCSCAVLKRESVSTLMGKPWKRFIIVA